jgi:hypothetical protein
MKDPVNMLNLLAELRQRPRGRACIVLTSNYGGQKHWAAQLARQTDSDHIHVLDEFVQNPQLSQKIGSILIADFFALLQSHTSKPVLIASGFEFLLAAWSGQTSSIEGFAVQVEMWNRTPALLLVMQFDNYLAERKFTRHPGNVFVIDQRNTLALT